MVHVNTFHIPSVEFTLLQTFSKGTVFSCYAPLVFRDALRDTVRFLALGQHIGDMEMPPASRPRVQDIIRINQPAESLQGHGYLETVKWVLPADSIIWKPKCFARIQNNTATDYMILMALFWRVNGASDLFTRYKKAFGSRGQLHKGDVTGIKVREFIDRHLPLAKYLDSLEDPTDGSLDPLQKEVPSGGRTDFLEDRDSITVVKRALKLEETPLEIIQGSGVLDDYELDDFVCEPGKNMEHVLGRIARRIRQEYSDEDLLRLYVPMPKSTIEIKIKDEALAECAVGGLEEELLLEGCVPQEQELFDEGAEAFNFYYPTKMTNVAECRQHSWYLACLTIINKAWEETLARESDVIDLVEDEEDIMDMDIDPDDPDDPDEVCDVDSNCDEEDDDEDEEEDDEEEEEGDDVEEEEESSDTSSSSEDDNAVAQAVDPKEKMIPVSLKNKKNRRPPVKWKHSAVVRHAFHRIVCAFVPLMFHAIRKNHIADEMWRLKPDELPSVMDMYFPHDTSCFHAGDLPAIDGILDQVGLYGVQAVKNKIALVGMTMKAMPVCCQSRDAVKRFLTECRLMNGEGCWRVIRVLFYCSMVGLYPHSEHRVDIRSAIRIYHMLFIDRNVFFAALEKESLKHEEAKKKTPSVKKTNKTCQLVHVAFREFFIHTVRDQSDWIAVVNQRINWEDFVDNTVNMADEMRRCARFAHAPEGDEILYAINALWRCKGEYGSDVYRYRKKEYTNTISEKMNKTRDNLHKKKHVETEEIYLIQALLDRLVEGEILTDSDLRPLLHSRHLDTLRTNRSTGVMHRDPTQLYRTNPQQFVVAARKSLEESVDWYNHLIYSVEPHIRLNILNFLLRTKPDERLDFDCLLDPRLGGVSRESVQTMAKTYHIYMTRSSPKSIKAHVQNLEIRDLCIFSWYFNIVGRLEKFNLIPLDADTVSRQAKAMRKYRYHLLDDEPLPPGAWKVFITFCCSRVTTFSNMPMYGNFAMSYDPVTCNFVCSKKVARTARGRGKGGATTTNTKKNQPAAAPSVSEENPIERASKEMEARNKKARADRRDDNFLPCEGQPALEIDLWGMALEYEGERYLFCPQCGQFHIWRDTNWGRRGYMCKSCRMKETPLNKLERCAYCGQIDRGHALKTLEIIAPTIDPCNEDHRPLEDPLSCYQTLHFCQADANSAGLFGKHATDRYHTFTPKDSLWPIIGPANSARTIANYKKYY